MIHSSLIYCTVITMFPIKVTLSISAGFQAILVYMRTYMTIYFFQNKVNKPYISYHKRSDQVIISRIRIGHSKLTHTYLLKGEQQPECIFCDCPLTWHHIFLDCSDTLTASNLLLNNVQSMQIFTKVSTDDILQFLQECDFYNKIDFFFYTFTFF